MQDRAADPSEGQTPKGPSLRTLIVTIGALFLLAGTSLVLHFAHFGGFSYLVGYGIALVMAVLVATVFMEIGHEGAAVHLAFAACLALFVLLLALMAADILTRTIPPFTPPPGNADRTLG